MIIGVQALNIRGGGGLSHLRNVVNAFEGQRNRFDRLILWVNSTIVSEVNLKHDWVDLKVINKSENIFFRHLWLAFFFKKEANQCDVLFVVGGVIGASVTVPVVSMSQNLLLFDAYERSRYAFGKSRLRLEILRYLQGKGFKKASKVIVLTDYARNIINKDIGLPTDKMNVVAHGIEKKYQLQPKIQKNIDSYSLTNPYKVLYVSTINAYKHQSRVIEAVSKLRRDGFPIELTLVGGGPSNYIFDMEKLMKSEDPESQFVKYLGKLSSIEVMNEYHLNDLFVFASSCENLPIILLEAMSAGLPIASSNVGPMPEVLKTNAAYFNPEDSADIYVALKALIEDPLLRQNYSNNSYMDSLEYSWDKCARKTLDIICSVYKESQNKH